MSIETDYHEALRHLAYARRLMLKLAVKADATSPIQPIIGQFDWLRRDCVAFVDQHLPDVSKQK